MKKWYHFIAKATPILLIVIAVILGIVAKFIEKFSANIAMGLQTITFILFVYAFIKFFDSKFK